MKCSLKFSAMLLAVSMLGSAVTLQAQEKSNTSAAEPTPQLATAIFASGCFWCTEADFEKVSGVVKAESGYIDGRIPNPSYEQVSAGNTGHTEAVRVYYEPSKVSYKQLLDHYWRNVDPTVKDRQFCDRGNQYRSGIYYQTKEQQQAAEASLATLKESGRFEKIYTEVKPATEFYVAEEYHQDYYLKKPVRYRYYRTSCGRDARLKELWGNK